VTLPSSPDLPFSTRGVAIRLFFTCWLIFSVHLATNTVREIYLALAIGDHFSFRVDQYGGMHPDLFEKPGHGWHIGNNPGASMLGAVPYALARPAIDVIVDRVNRARVASGRSEPPGYASPRPMARAFYQEAWRRGYDIKFRLASVVMFARKVNPTYALSHITAPYPSTALYEQVKNDPSFRFSDGTLFPEAIENDHFTLRELKRVTRKAYLNYYLRPSYIWSRLARGEISALAGQVRLFLQFVRS